MPRKKVTVLDRVDIPCIEGGVQSAIVKSLNELPPATYLLVTETPDQRQLWNGAKKEFQMIGAIIDSHFSGEAPPTLSHLEKYQKEDIWNTAWRYLSFYSMVWANWEVVRQDLHNKGAPPMPPAAGNGCVFSPTGKAFSSLETPLLVVVEVIRYRAIATMADAFVPYKAYIPNQIRDSIKNTEAAKRPDADQQFITKVKADVLDRIKARPYDWLEQRCALSVIKSRPNGVQKKALKNYLDCCQERKTLALKVNHRRNKAKRTVWKKGEVLNNVRN